MRSRIALGLGIAFTSTGLVLGQVAPPNTARMPVTAAQQVEVATQVVTLQQQIASLQAAVAALQLKTQLLNSNGITTSITSGASAVTVGPTGVALVGTIVTLNASTGGGRPIARLGDSVTVSAGYVGTIATGSTTVLIGQ